MRREWLAAAALVAAPAPASAQDETGLLFRASADRDLTAEVAAGDPRPNFRAKVEVVPDGRLGGAAAPADDGYVAWNAPGNMRSARGTLAFFWRARTPVGAAPFVIFRAGFADHSSWDMAFLRIDWNGHGFDAFVTDANLARRRVSVTFPVADPKAWHHIAFSWDEGAGVVLYVDGREAGRLAGAADLDAGLDQFGLAGRVIAPHQVQSRYNFTRGSDVDEIRVYDRALPAADAARLAAGGEAAPPPARAPAPDAGLWAHRYGWDRGLPPPLTAPVTRVRKVEFADAYDLKQWMWKGVDGIAETTWPGVYNRSRLPGRDDYFELPDWNTYAEGGRRYDLTIPAGERVNRVELRGSAYGRLGWTGPDGRTRRLADRPLGPVRTVDAFAPVAGGRLSFTNTVPEQPIQELWAYDVGAGAVPAGSFQLSYTVDASAATDLAALDELNRWLAGRYPPDERSAVVAMPAAGVRAAVGAGSAASNGRATADWWGGTYGWGFSPVVPGTGRRENRNRVPRSITAFLNGTLLTGDGAYMELWRRQRAVLAGHARTIEGAAQVPTMYGPQGWYGWTPGPDRTNGFEIWYATQSPDDRAAAGDHPWIAFLEGRNPRYPEAALDADMARVAGRVARREADRTTRATRLADWPIGINPASVTSLVQQTVGGLHIARPPWSKTSPAQGGVTLHSRLHWFDADARRAGLPPDVGALVTAMDDRRCEVTLVNTGARPRTAVVQGGAYAEHRIDGLRVDGRPVAGGGAHATLRLAPGCGAGLSLAMTRYANRPTLAFPWDR